MAIDWDNPTEEQKNKLWDMFVKWDRKNKQPIFRKDLKKLNVKFKRTSNL